MLGVLSPSILRPIAAWMAPPPTYYIDFLGAQTGGLTVTRADATATYFGADGLLATAAANVHRIDHDPLTMARLGLLREPARTNRALYARDLTNAAWVKTSTTADMDQIGLDGVADSASSLTATGDNGTALQTVTVTSAERTLSLYLKRLVGTGTVEITIDNGTTWTDVTSSLSSSAWARVDRTQTLANPVFGVRLGTSGDSVAVDFVQVEDGHCPTSPIATTSASVQRNADAIVLSGAPFNQVWNAAEGTALVEWSMMDAPAASAFPPLLSFNDTGGNERINLFLSEASDGFFLGCVDGGAAQVTGMTVPGAAYDGTPQRIAGAWKLNTIRMAAMGTLSALDTSATIPTVTQMQVGDQASALGPASTPVWFRRIAYWGVRLPDEVLVALTR